MPFIWALALALLAPAAAGADTAQVTVVSPGGAEQTLALEALSGGEDVAARAYAVRSSSGEGSRTVSGFSLAALIDAAGADPYSFSYLRVQRPGGGAVQLSRDQALDAGAFPDGPPVVYATADGTGFLRPSSGPGDLNAVDCFEAPQGISIVLSKASPIRVRAEASEVRAEAGERIGFRAEVEGGGAGERLEYSWYFDDGSSASGATAAHVFHERGSYDVVLGVTAPGDGAGASDVVTVQVGPPASGPDRRGGGTNEDANAPDHGAADGAPVGGGSPGGGAPAPAAAPRTAPATPPAPPAVESSEARPVPSPRRPAGELVSGELVSSESAAPPAPPETAAARTGRLADDDGDGGAPGLPGSALGLLLTGGLLGLGALSEVRPWR